jgi:hypothetical protein
VDYFLHLSATFELGDLSLREVLMKRPAKVSDFFYFLWTFDYSARLPERSTNSPYFRGLAVARTVRLQFHSQQAKGLRSCARRSQDENGDHEY